MLPDEEKTLSIAKRTLKNLNFIYEAKNKGSDVEEFTHLLNSMLCMVICLREEYFLCKNVSWDEITRKNLTPVVIDSAPPNDVSPKLSPHKNFSQLISKVRHGLSHNCFSLCGDINKKITGIIIWNIPSGKTNVHKNRTWQASMSEQQLKDLSYLFINFIQKEFSE